MENVKVLKCLGVRFEIGMRGNIQLENLRKKAEEWGARISCMIRVNEGMEVD